MYKGFLIMGLGLGTAAFAAVACSSGDGTEPGLIRLDGGFLGSPPDSGAVGGAGGGVGAGVDGAAGGGGTGVDGAAGGGTGGGGASPGDGGVAACFTNPTTEEQFLNSCGEGCIPFPNTRERLPLLTPQGGLPPIP